jgi:hypothetical protein
MSFDFNIKPDKEIPAFLKAPLSQRDKELATRNIDELNSLAQDYFGRMLAGGLITMERSTTKNTCAGVAVTLFFFFFPRELNQDPERNVETLIAFKLYKKL